MSGHSGNDAHGAIGSGGAVCERRRARRVRGALLEEGTVRDAAKHSTLVAPRRTSLGSRMAAALPLILPTSTHGLRRRIAAEFEQGSLQARIVAEIDSLSLLMNCVHNGMGATIKPMAAVYLERERGTKWRTLSIADAHMSRRNYLYSLPPARLATAAAVVAAERKATALELIASGAWTGVEPITPAAPLPPAPGPFARSPAARSRGEIPAVPHDVDLRQLRIERPGTPGASSGAKGRSAADLVARVAMRRLGLAGLVLFTPPGARGSWSRPCASPCISTMSGLPASSCITSVFTTSCSGTASERAGISVPPCSTYAYSCSV